MAVCTLHLEKMSALETKLSKKSIPRLKEKVISILAKIPGKSVSEWDSFEEKITNIIMREQS